MKFLALIALLLVLASCGESKIGPKNSNQNQNQNQFQNGQFNQNGLYNQGYQVNSNLPSSEIDGQWRGRRGSKRYILTIRRDINTRSLYITSLRNKYISCQDSMELRLSKEGNKAFKTYGAPQVSNFLSCSSAIKANTVYEYRMVEGRLTIRRRDTGKTVLRLRRDDSSRSYIEGLNRYNDLEYGNNGGFFFQFGI